jgi:hypothetical protein
MAVEDVFNALRGLWAFTWDFVIVVSSAIFLAFHTLSYVPFLTFLSHIVDSHRRAQPGPCTLFSTSLSLSLLLFRCVVNVSHDLLFRRCTTQPDPFTYAVIRRSHLMVHALCAFRAAWGCQLLIKDVHTRLKVSRVARTHPKLDSMICPAGLRPPRVQSRCEEF